MMAIKTRTVLAALGMLVFTMSGAHAADLPTVNLGISSWTGFAPLFVAQEKGFFQKEGVDVKLQRIEVVANRRSALAANAIQGFPTTVNTWVTTAAAGVPVVQVLALDDSYGADGIVAKKGIDSFKDLAGHTVGLETGGGASYFWFLYLLDQNHMKLSEVKIKDMSAGDAGAAFAAGRLDAAVTWEPWLTNARNTTFGHVLMTSKASPGVIADTLGFRADFVRDHPQAVQAVVNAWFDALDYVASHKQDAYAIMAKAMNQTPKDFADSASGVRWYDRGKNQHYFGTAAAPGPLYDLTREAVDLYMKEGIIDNKPEVPSMIDAKFIGGN